MQQHWNKFRLLCYSTLVPSVRKESDFWSSFMPMLSVVGISSNVKHVWAVNDALTTFILNMQKNCIMDQFLNVHMLWYSEWSAAPSWMLQ